MLPFVPLMIAGMGLALAGGVLTARLGWVRWRETKAGRRSPRLDTLTELSAPVLVWGGIALEIVDNFAWRLARHAAPRPFGLSTVAAVSVVLMLGFLLGRLHARWQLRLADGLIDGKTGAIRPPA